ncbi:complement C1q tumor necrosis factor-related protein 6 [Lingula anatina]|uniref:Complement C1q tumor necrosis factor-related protein 6 n=1 Tax=Lingula anatina TaxID=7574 RepID=A0A1S3IJY7_LINAN|nr:complement C1q tumor necrosis factor-related protein 6 [Lingula anatina]|eukprot:XP_013398186.1 complement C1q tumor necrosis factor-related protein 6 [Lingula anatina]
MFPNYSSVLFFGNKWRYRPTMKVTALYLLAATVAMVVFCVEGQEVSKCAVSYRHVAFSAGRSTDLQATGKPAIIIYDAVILNEGHAYDEATGIFTAPMSGVFVFHFHAINYHTKRLYLWLVHNGKRINSGYAHPTQHYATGSNSAALHLTEGDRVWIELENGYGLHNHPGENHSTFTGYLLYPENSGLQLIATG